MHDATVSELSPAEATDLVVRTIQANADSLLRVARRHSLCADDAQDAYQRALEIFMRRASTVRPETAAAWLRAVVKHEAMAVRASRLQIVGAEDVDMDAHEAGHLPSPEEQLLSFDMVTRSAEALQRLKPQEVRALWLKAAGHSYEQIAESTGWTYTKVNRCIAEGRKSFLARYASIESGEECDRWAPVVSAMIDGEATPQQVLDVRPHLRNCSACRAVMRDADRQSASLAALFPVGAGVGAGGGQAVPAPDAGGFLARIYEAVASTVHERAVASAIKVQAALDAATAGKVAAVAASAAAVAGGGVAVVDKAVVARDGAERRQIAHRAPAAARAAVSAAAGPAPVASRPDSAGSARRARRGTAADREFGSDGGSSGQVASEFAPAGAGPTARAASTSGAQSPASSAPAPRSSSPVERSGEFSP